jgi:hypothetical protein
MDSVNSFQSIGTRVLQRFTTLVDGAKDIEMTVGRLVCTVYKQELTWTILSTQRDRWTKSILPIGALFSGSLILSNYAYLRCVASRESD